MRPAFLLPKNLPAPVKGAFAEQLEGEREQRNGSTVICGGRKVDSGVRTAQLSAHENEL